MFDNDNIVNSLPTITIYIHTKMHIYIYIYTNIHSVNIHSYTIQINPPIGHFINKWANGTKYCGLYRTSVGNVGTTRTRSSPLMCLSSAASRRRAEWLAARTPQLNTVTSDHWSKILEVENSPIFCMLGGGWPGDD